MDRSYLNHALSWSRCKDLVAEDRLELLGRSHSQHASYHAFMDNVRSKYAEVADFLFTTKFGFDAAVDPVSGKLRAVVPTQVPDRLILQINDFPYHYEKGIVHYVLWKLGTPLVEQEILDAQASLLAKEGAVEAIFYVNPPHLKSILQIDHAHILVHVPAGSVALESDRKAIRDPAAAALEKFGHLVISPTPAGLHKAAEILRSGGLVAFPTETVYGLGANALDAGAVLSIFTAKGRPLTDPLIVHVPDADAAAALLELSAEERAVLDVLSGCFWPGPLTCIAKAAPAIPLSVTANTGFVGVRVPQHPLALELLRACALPIAAPSANRFGHVSPTRAGHVLHDLGEKGVHVLSGDQEAEAETEAEALDAGATCAHGIESTVARIDGARRRLVIFRQGAVTQRALEAALSAASAAAAAAGKGLEGWQVTTEVRTIPMPHSSSSPSSSSSSSGAQPSRHQHQKQEEREREDGAATGQEGQEAPGQLITHYAPDVPCVAISSIALGPRPALASKSGSQGEEEEGEREGPWLQLSRAELQRCVVLDFHSRLSLLLAQPSPSPGYSGHEDESLLGYRDLSRSGSSRQAARNLFDYLRWAEAVPGAERVLLASVGAASGPLHPEGEAEGEAEAEGEGGLLLGLHDRMFRACSGRTVALFVVD